MVVRRYAVSRKVLRGRREGGEREDMRSVSKTRESRSWGVFSQ